MEQKLVEFLIDVESSTVERPQLDPVSFFAQFMNPNMLQNLSAVLKEPIKHWNSGLLAPIGKVLTPSEVENTALTYGDERGKAYIASLERFTKNIDSGDFDVEKQTDFLTRGAHKVYLATEKFLEDGTTSGQIEVECGQICVEDQIEESKKEVEKILDFLELDLAKTSANSCLELTRNLTQEDLKRPFSIEFLNENRSGFEAILRNEIPIEEKVKLLDEIKVKLIMLVRYSNDPNFDYGQRARQQQQQQQTSNPYIVNNMQQQVRPMNGNAQQMQQNFNQQMMRPRPDQNQQQQMLMQQQIQMQMLQQQQMQKMREQQQLMQSQQQANQQMLSGQQIQVNHQMLSGQAQMPMQQMMNGQQQRFQQMPNQQGPTVNCANCGAICKPTGTTPLCYGNFY